MSEVTHHNACPVCGDGTAPVDSLPCEVCDDDLRDITLSDEEEALRRDRTMELRADVGLALVRSGSDKSWPDDLLYPAAEFPNGAPYCCGGHECACQGLPMEPPLPDLTDWRTLGLLAKELLASELSAAGLPEGAGREIPVGARPPASSAAGEAIGRLYLTLHARAERPG